MNNKNFIVVLLFIMTVLSVNCTQLEYMKAVISAIEQKDYVTDEGFNKTQTLIKNDHSSSYDIEKLLINDMETSNDPKKYDKEIMILNNLEEKYKYDIRNLNDIRIYKLRLMIDNKKYDDAKAACLQYYQSLTDSEYKSFMLNLTYLDHLRVDSYMIKININDDNFKVHNQITTKIVAADINNYLLMSDFTGKTDQLIRIYFDSSIDLLNNTDFNDVKNLRFNFIVWNELSKLKKSSLIIWKTPEEEKLVTDCMIYLKSLKKENNEKSIVDAADIIMKVLIKEKN